MAYIYYVFKYPVNQMALELGPVSLSVSWSGWSNAGDVEPSEKVSSTTGVDARLGSVRIASGLQGFVLRLRKKDTDEKNLPTVSATPRARKTEALEPSRKSVLWAPEWESNDFDHVVPREFGNKWTDGIPGWSAYRALKATQGWVNYGRYRAPY